MGSFWKLVSGQTEGTRVMSFLLLDIILFCNNNDAIVRAFICILLNRVHKSVVWE